MAFTVQNRARHLLVLPLNSGGTLHLAPGETSPPVEAYELENNEKVERLSKEGLVVVTAPEGQGAAAEEMPPREFGPAEGRERRRNSGRN